MESDKVSGAIKTHGAKRVYEAAAARMSGNPAQLQACGLEAATIGEANAIMSAAFEQMGPAERAADLADASAK